MKHVLRRLRRAFVEGRAAMRTALRGMIANRLRAFLSMLGIAIGIATLTAIMALTEGLSNKFTEQISMLGANTLYIQSRPWVIRGDWWKYRNRPKISRADVEALERRADLLTAVAPVAFAQAEVRYQGEHLPEVLVRGTNDRYLDTTNFKIEYGRFLSAIDVDLDKPVVVVGAEVAERITGDRAQDALGLQIRIGDGRFTVIGVLRPQGKTFGRSLDMNVAIPMLSFRRLFGERRDQGIAVTALPENLNAAQDQVIEVLRRARGLSADQEDNFAVNKQAELVKFFNEETAAIFMVALIVGLITLLVGGIGVMNIMLVAVTERTREIGVRRALGARKRTILLQFLLEASLVTLVGGAVGVALGMGGAQLMSLVTPIVAQASPQAAVAGLVSSAVVGLLFGTWPAYRAAKLDPIESLRYE